MDFPRQVYVQPARTVEEARLRSAHAMDCDWIFVSQDRTQKQVTLQEMTLPQLGDGKAHDERHYEVVFVGEKLVSRPNAVVVAVEFVQRS